MATNEMILDDELGSMWEGADISDTPSMRLEALKNTTDIVNQNS
jgi:hypothetical protein